jgi:hypothetical protein
MNDALETMIFARRLFLALGDKNLHDLGEGLKTLTTDP